MPVAANFGQCALRAGGADNQAHALRHIELFDNFLQLFAVAAIIDFARNTAAARRVRHQHAIATGQRHISRQRRALIAALFFHHLHQNDLPTLNDFLNFIFAVQIALIHRRRGFFMSIAADIGNGVAIGFFFAVFLLIRAGIIVRSGLLAVFFGLLGQ